MYMYYIYIYIYMHLYVFMCICFYIYLLYICSRLTLKPNIFHPFLLRRLQAPAWPFQCIVLLIVVCARISRPFILRARLHCPDFCNTITRLLGNMRPRPDPLFVSNTPYNIGNNNIV